jgi:hypothetical protein
MLSRLAWSSLPSREFSAARLNEIIVPSRRNNERNHVSGMLLFTGALFLGILEGHREDLSKLWRKLERDSRHTDLVRIGEESCGVRWFPRWLMAYLDHAEVGEQIDGLRSLPPAAHPWSPLIRPIMMRAGGT